MHKALHLRQTKLPQWPKKGFWPLMRKKHYWHLAYRNFFHFAFVDKNLVFFILYTIEFRYTLYSVGSKRTFVFKSIIHFAGWCWQIFFVCSEVHLKLPKRVSRPWSRYKVSSLGWLKITQNLKTKCMTWLWYNFVYVFK